VLLRAASPQRLKNQMMSVSTSETSASLPFGRKRAAQFPQAGAFGIADPAGIETVALMQPERLADLVARRGIEQVRGLL